MSSEHEQLAFGEFTLDATRREVQRRDGTLLPLTPRLFNALYTFASRPGDLLDKRELMQLLWPGLVVSENNLSQLVSALRRVLGDGAAQFIRTEPRRGFRFTAQVTARHAPTTPAVTAAAMPRASLAVLPFLALTNDPRETLLGIGMADTLIARLSVLPQLVVRSVGSVRRFADGRSDAAQAGRLLDVDWVVDGTLQQLRGRLRVSARLVAVPAGTAAWSDRFDEEMTGVFDVQDSIARRVADALGGHLSQSSGGTRNIDSYQFYLAGLNHAQGFRDDGLKRSVELFRHALTIDASYALAHVGIAEACRRMIFGADRAPLEVFAQWREHQAQALEIAPALPEVHAQLGWFRYWCEHDWPGAERAFRHSLSINPSLSHARFGLGFMLVTIGRCDEGLALVRAAHALDPMSLLVSVMEATFLLRMGDVQASVALIQRELKVAPQFWIAHMAMAVWQEQQGQSDAALASIATATQLADQSTQAVALQGAMLARRGRREEARQILARLEGRERERYVPPTSLATVQEALGEKQLALASLERAFECNDTRLLYLRSDPRWASLRSEPRFLDLVARMNQAGLPPGLAPP
jgi:TolB-like protein/tetratricopeptide (TPR) repeat protein